ncbi:HK97-gp10 family putative phage morphogenesis protein, partial [Escherichia coli]|nr:hypothetical protein [Escherichia coli]MDG5521347.1 hypothetical protein [Escherichia coli]MDG5530710.1 hypothetical protein [Escherichia coli]MDG5535591.1 hypothetical protein [Escherichia coli]MDG5540468.1 hypothetical protein [Escherichia coli]
MKASDPRNAFYWRFVELGTINMPAHPFIRPAFDTTEELAAQIKQHAAGFCRSETRNGG